MVTSFEIQLTELAVEDLCSLNPFEQRRVLEEIEEHLTIDPLRTSRRRKMLIGIEPPWERSQPVWQLRVGDIRVFYDADEARRVVWVRAIRRKGRKTTKEIV